MRPARAPTIAEVEEDLAVKEDMAEIEADMAADLDFPVITGLENRPIANLAANNGPLVAALRFISYAGRGSSSLPRQNISELHLTEKGELVLYLADRPFPISLGKEINRNKYNRLAKVLYRLYKKREFSSVEYIKMDYAVNKILVGKNK